MKQVNGECKRKTENLKKKKENRNRPTITKRYGFQSRLDALKGMTLACTHSRTTFKAVTQSCPLLLDTNTVILMLRPISKFIFHCRIYACKNVRYVRQICNLKSTYISKHSCHVALWKVFVIALITDVYSIWRG